MNLNTTTVVSIMIGTVLLYSAVKKKDPRDVVREALGLKAKYHLGGGEQGFLKPIAPSGGGGGMPSFTNNNALGNLLPLPLG
jgi:hypothetical protein